MNRSVLLLMALLVGCGGEVPPPVPPPRETPPPPPPQPPVPNAPTSEALAPASSPAPPAPPFPAPRSTGRVKVKAVDDPAAHEVFQLQVGELEKCYADALARDPVTDVMWACFFVRDARGKVTSAKIPGEPHQELRACIIDVVRKAKFGPPAKVDERQTFFVSMKKGADHDAMVFP